MVFMEKLSRITGLKKTNACIAMEQEMIKQFIITPVNIVCSLVMDMPVKAVYGHLNLKKTSTKSKKKLHKEVFYGYNQRKTN